MQHQQSRLAELTKTSIICFDWIEKTKHADKANSNWQQLNEYKKRHDRVAKLKKNWDDLLRTFGSAESILDLTRFVQQEQIQTVDKLAKAEQRRQQLLRLANRVNLIQQEEKRLQSAKSQFENTDMWTKTYEKASNRQVRLLRLHQLKQQENELAIRIREGKSFLNGHKNKMFELEREFEQKLLLEQKCPLCGSKVESGNIHQLFHS